MKLILQISVFILFISCSASNGIVNSGKHEPWRQINNSLYIDTNGSLGFATDPSIVNIPRSELEGERCANVFLTTIGSQGEQSLNEIIDTSTFIELGASFYMDKNHIYNYYAMCEGGYLNIFSRDTSNFKILSSCYASHDSTIYHHRNGPLDADFESFVVSSEFSCTAKDKNGYFRYDDRISNEELKSEMGQEAFSKLEEELSYLQPLKSTNCN